MFDVDELSKDDFLGGAIKIWQPKNGYRAGMDPILLAANCKCERRSKSFRSWDAALAQQVLQSDFV